MRNGIAHLVEVSAGGVHWHVVPECREQLLGPAGLRLDDWLRAGQAEAVKHGPHRTVYRVNLPGLRCYVKHYRLHDTRAWLRELVRPSKARMEHERALAVSARGVRTVVPVALGECGTRLAPGDSFLVTRSVDNAIPLNEFIETALPRLPSCRQAHLRQRLAVELGSMLARMHEAGILHHDLHAGNLLLQLGEDDQPRLYLIDLHAVVLGPSLAWPTRRRNLVVLNRWFVLRVGRSDRLRFWRAYFAAWSAQAWRGASRTHALTLARDLEQATWESNLRFWRARDRRCLATNRYFRRVHSATAAGFAVTDLDPAALAPMLDDPDGPFRRPGVMLLKDSRSSTVAEFDASVGGVVRRVIYKRFRVTDRSDPWKALVRRSPALRSWVFGHGLRERCLPTARPLLVLHRRRRGLSYEGYLLTEKIPDAVELQRFVASLDALAPAERRRALRHLLDQLARLVLALHQRRLSHRDLKAANILVDRESLPTVPCPLPTVHLWLIDLVGIERHRRLSRARRVQNLTRLNASFLKDPGLTRTDRLRFLRVYLRWGLGGRAGWKRWWREIEEATQAKAAKNLRNGRMLA